MDKRTRDSPEVRERMVRLVHEQAQEHGSQWAAIQSIATKVGCKPVENAYVESFHSRFRDDRLSTHWFETVPDARVHIECWRQDDNEVRPHTSLAGRTPTEFAKTLKENDQITRHSA
jgi:putative transposase